MEAVKVSPRRHLQQGEGTLVANKRAPLALGSVSLAWDDSGSSSEEEDEEELTRGQSEQGGGEAAHTDTMEEVVSEPMAADYDCEDDNDDIRISKFSSLRNRRGRSMSVSSSPTMSLTIPRGGDALPGAKARRMLGLDSDGFQLGPGGDWETDDERITRPPSPFHPRALVNAFKGNGKKRRKRHSKALAPPPSSSHKATDYGEDRVPSTVFLPSSPTARALPRTSTSNALGVGLQTVTSSLRATGSSQRAKALPITTKVQVTKETSCFECGNDDDDGRDHRGSALLPERNNEYNIKDTKSSETCGSPGSMKGDQVSTSVPSERQRLEKSPSSNLSSPERSLWQSISNVGNEAVLRRRQDATPGLLSPAPPPRPARSHFRRCTLVAPTEFTPSTSTATRELSPTSMSPTFESPSSFKRRSSASLATFSSVGCLSDFSSGPLSPNLSTSSSLSNSAALLASPISRGDDSCSSNNHVRKAQTYQNPLLSPLQFSHGDEGEHNDNEFSPWQRSADPTARQLFVRSPSPFEEPRKAPVPPGGSSDALSLLVTTGATGLGIESDDYLLDHSQPPQTLTGKSGNTSPSVIRRIASEESAIIDPMLYSTFDESQDEEEEERGVKNDARTCSIYVQLSRSASSNSMTQNHDDLGLNARAFPSPSNSAHRGRDVRPMSIPISPTSLLSFDWQVETEEPSLDQAPLREDVEYEEDEFSKAIARMTLEVENEKGVGNIPLRRSDASGLASWRQMPSSPSSPSYVDEENMHIALQGSLHPRHEGNAKRISSLRRRSTDLDDRDFADFLRMQSR